MRVFVLGAGPPLHAGYPLAGLSASKQSDGGKVLRTAAQAYKVDTDAIALKVKHEFAAKEKARSATKIEPKPVPKALKKTA